MLRRGHCQLLAAAQQLHESGGDDVVARLRGMRVIWGIVPKAKEGADTILDVAKYILAAVLGIALVFVIYSLATNNPHAKEYLLGWIIAVVVIMVAFLII